MQEMGTGWRSEFSLRLSSIRLCPTLYVPHSCFPLTLRLFPEQFLQGAFSSCGTRTRAGTWGSSTPDRLGATRSGFCPTPLLGLGNSRSRCQDMHYLVMSLQGGRGEGALWGLSYKEASPIANVLSSWSNHLHPINATTVKVRLTACNVWGT